MDANCPESYIAFINTVINFKLAHLNIISCTHSQYARRWRRCLFDAQAEAAAIASRGGPPILVLLGRYDTDLPARPSERAIRRIFPQSMLNLEVFDGKHAFFLEHKKATHESILKYLSGIGKK